MDPDQEPAQDRLGPVPLLTEPPAMYDDGDTTEPDVADGPRGAGPRSIRVALVAAFGLVVAGAVALALLPQREFVTADAPRGDGRGVTSNVAAAPTRVGWSVDRRLVGGPLARGVGPVLGNDDIVVLADGRHVHGVDATTGERLWSVGSTGFEVAGDHVLWPHGDGTYTVTPLVDVGRTVEVAVGAHDHRIVGATDDHVAFATRDRVVGFDLRTGDRVWQRDDRAVSVDGPTATGGQRPVLVEAGDRLLALDATTGDVRASVPWGSGWQVLATDHTGAVLLVADEGTARYAVELDTETVTRLELPASRTVNGLLERADFELRVPVDRGGEVLVESYDLRNGRSLNAGPLFVPPAPIVGTTTVRLVGEELIAFSPWGEERWRRDVVGSVAEPTTTVAGGGLVLVAREVHVEAWNVSDGLERWRMPWSPPRPFDGDGWTPSGPLLAQDGRVLAPNRAWTLEVTPDDPGDGDAELGTVIATGPISTVRASDREVTVEGPGGTVRATLAARSRWESLAVTPDFVVVGEAGTATVVDRRTGERSPPANLPEGSFLFSDGHRLYAVYGRLEHHEVSIEGLQRRWVAPIPTGARSAVGVRDDLWVLGPWSVTILDGGSGEVAHEARLPRPISPVLAATDDVVIATSGDRVVALSADGAQLAWEHQLDELVTSAPTIAGDAVYVGLRSGEVVWLDLGDGTERGRVDTGDGDVIGSITVAHGTVYAYAERGRTLVALVP